MPQEPSTTQGGPLEAACGDAYFAVERSAEDWGRIDPGCKYVQVMSSMDSCRQSEAVGGAFAEVGAKQFDEVGWLQNLH